jgi:hypothetical protein
MAQIFKYELCLYISSLGNLTSKKSQPFLVHFDGSYSGSCMVLDSILL